MLCVCNILVCTIWVTCSAVLAQLCTAGVVSYILFVGVCLVVLLQWEAFVCAALESKTKFPSQKIVYKVYIVVMFSIASYCIISYGNVPYPMV